MKTLFKLTFLALFVLAALTFTAVGVPPAHAASCTVITDADSDVGSLRAQLADTGCDSIGFDGDYTINLASTLSIGRDVIIDGTGHAVIISGDTDGDGTGTEQQVFTIQSGITVALQNLTVADGYILGNGGGIHNSGTLTVANVTFTSNMAAGSTGGGYYGGAVFNQGSLTVTESVFSGNRAGGTAQGGAIANSSGGVVTVSGSTFDNNQGDMGGGALFNEGELTVDDCALTGNIGLFFGGGAIWNLSDNLVVTNSVFSDNTTQQNSDYPAYGGAILNFGTMSAEGNTFDGNSATYGGAVAGITHPGYATLTKANSLTNNTFRGNSATDSGGAVHAVAYGDGNAITINLKNNTLAVNSAPTGGNLYLGLTDFGTLTAEFYNNILVKGTTGENCVFFGDSSAPTPTASHNLADDNSCGAGFTYSGSILLGELSDNGGPTQTIPLSAGSSAIDAGDDNVCPDTDQRGVSRPQDGDGDGTAVCNIGAYEQYEPSADVVYATEVLYENAATNSENALGGPDDMAAELSVDGSYLHLGFAQSICTSLTVYGQGTISLFVWSTDWETLLLQVDEAVLNGSASFEFNGQSDYVVIRNNLEGNTLTIDALEGIACTGAENNPPIADPGGTYYGEVDTPVSFDGSGSSDPDGDPLTYAWTFGDDGTGSGVNPTHSYAATGTYDVCLTVNDGLLDSETICRSANISAAPSNTAPIAVPGGPYSGEVNTLISFDGSASYDPDGDELTYSWTFGDSGTGGGVNPTHSYTADGTYPVCLTVNDETVNSDPVCTTAEITVPNTPPTADPGGPYLVAVNGSIALDGSGSSDPDGDALTESWTAYGGTVSGSTYTAGSEAGIYDVCLLVSDGTLSDANCTLAVVYDPSDGFVTGGGWIDSPAGAYTADPSLASRATFGFVSKYKKGAAVPDGNTEFQFQAGGFYFHSTAYDWLVVSKDKVTAQFKGSGTVNGAMDPNGNPYKFMLWAGDGTSPDGLDTFRIRIWWESDDGVEHDVYDNGVEQAIGGGSIVVHTGK